MNFFTNYFVLKYRGRTAASYYLTISHFFSNSAETLAGALIVGSRVVPAGIAHPHCVPICVTPETS